VNFRAPFASSFARRAFASGVILRIFMFLWRDLVSPVDAYGITRPKSSHLGSTNAAIAHKEFQASPDLG
jgi:hypothetical protein